MPQMKAVQVSKPNGPLEVVSREIPRPGPREALIKVQACGVCHSDSITVGGIRASPGTRSWAGSSQSARRFPIGRSDRESVWAGTEATVGIVTRAGAAIS